MDVAIGLPIRTWAALDVALGFFRAAPKPLADARLTRHCRKLHNLLRRAGIHGRYALIGTASTGKSLLRLHVDSEPPPRVPWVLRLPRGSVRTLTEACWTVLRTHHDPQLASLLDYEAEELQAARAFLSEVRRQWPEIGHMSGKPGGALPLAWDEQHDEYVFTSPVAERIQRHYLRVGAGVN